MCCCVLYVFLFVLCLFLSFVRFFLDASCVVDCFLCVVDVILFVCFVKHVWHVCVI